MARVGVLEAGGTKMVCAMVELDRDGKWNIWDRVSIPTRTPMKHAGTCELLYRQEI